MFEDIVVRLAGISEEDCGLNQASILASPKLHKGKLSYVDDHMKGRVRSLELQQSMDRDLEFLWTLLGEKTKIHAEITL